MTDIDTINQFLVGAAGGGDEIVIMNPPRRRMTRDEALTLAAWIVAICDHDDRWEQILAAVKAT